MQQELRLQQLLETTWNFWPGDEERDGDEGDEVDEVDDDYHYSFLSKKKGETRVVETIINNYANHVEWPRVWGSLGQLQGHSKWLVILFLKI